MNKNHLQAEVITDRRGRVTTVHRRIQPNAADPKKLPSPPRPGGTKAKTVAATPLEPLPNLTDTQYKQYLAYAKQNVMSRRKTNPKREEIELIHRMIHSGVVSDETVGTVTDYMGMFSPGERIPQYDYNFLLLTERYCKDSGSDTLSRKDAGVFANAVQGLCYTRDPAKRVPLEKITTEEELAGHVAVLRFIMATSKDSYGEHADPDRVVMANGRTVELHVMKNHALAELLREQPDKYDHIVQYALERGVPRFQKEVPALREYLKDVESNAVLSDGWL